MSSPLRRCIAAALALGCAAAAAPATGAADAPAAAPVRGTVLQADRIATLSRAELAARVRAFGLPAARAHVGVDAFRLTYATVGVAGAPTTATGLVLLPRSHRRRLAVVSYAHGTLAARADAPSRGLDNLASASALLFGGAGYATVAPDYLGLGYGPGTHPYMHVATEGSASLDMLRAAHAFALRRHRVLDDRTLVTGFSQGGVAAMALGRLLQDGADARLALRALAPMSGPFDIEHAEIPALLAGRLDPSTSNYYLSYVLRSWQPIYHVYDAPGDVWTGPWGARVARLFDGRHDDVAILKALPQRLERLFTPAFRARLAHPDGGLLAAMRANDGTCDWAPAVPTRIYAARADEQVAFDNARSCTAGLRARGAHVRLLDVGRRDHFGSTLAATPRVLRWFAGLGR